MQGQPVAGFFAHNCPHFSTINPFSDHSQANTLHSTGKKSYPIANLSAPGLLLLMLGSCQEAPDAPAEQLEPEVVVDSSCGDNARLATELYGGIARQINWSAAELHCESMLRPEGKGVRLRFTGDAADNRLSIILALPELQRGTIASESPTVVTLTVEGSGRFFTTPTLESCWSDIVAQERIDDGGDTYDISGTLYCVAPLGEINGDAAISIPEMAFRGIVDWNSK